MKTVIHVNQAKIRKNKSKPYCECEPVLTIKDYKSNRYGFEAHIFGQDGELAAKIVYKPNKPLSCGAKVWLETKGKVLVF